MNVFYYCCFGYTTVAYCGADDDSDTAAFSTPFTTAHPNPYYVSILDSDGTAYSHALTTTFFAAFECTVKATVVPTERATLLSVGTAYLWTEQSALGGPLRLSHCPTQP